MKAIRLIASPDEYDDALGFILKGCQSFDGLTADRDGMTTAHDVLEHQNGVKAMGPVWDELEALGAVWYVRGRWGDFLQLDPRRGSMHSPESNMASDVTRMFMQWVDEDQGYFGPGGWAVGSRAHDEDEAFDSILAIAARDIPREHNDMGNGSPGEDENGWSEDLRNYLPEYLELARRRMRHGYRKAQRRFERGGASRFYAGNLFVAIRDAVGKAVRWIDYEGQEFILRYGDGEATCTPAHEMEDY